MKQQEGGDLIVRSTPPSVTESSRQSAMKPLELRPASRSAPYRMAVLPGSPNSAYHRLRLGGVATRSMRRVPGDGGVQLQK